MALTCRVSSSLFWRAGTSGHDLRRKGAGERQGPNYDRQSNEPEADLARPCKKANVCRGHSKRKCCCELVKVAERRVFNRSPAGGESRGESSCHQQRENHCESNEPLSAALSAAVESDSA